MDRSVIEEEEEEEEEEDTDLHVKDAIFCRIFKKFNILATFPKNPQISYFMKVRAVGADLFHADGQTDGRTDTTNLIVAFRKFR